MSRIGKKPVNVPSGVKINLDTKQRTVAVEGPKGKLSMTHRPEVTVKWDEDEKQIVCSIPEAATEDGQMKAYWGLTRSLIENMITGVTQGYTKKLEIVGVGWNARVQGKSLELNVGYCHPVSMPIPQGVEVNVENNVNITITGPDKHAVGQFAANIRSNREPEPYNGKGIKYHDEYIIRKQGKAFGA